MFTREYLSDVNHTGTGISKGAFRSAIETLAVLAAAFAVAICADLASPIPLLAQDNIQESVVRILATRRFPDWQRPWMKSSPQEVSGSGVVIDGNRILTNAHLVTYARSIYVQPHGSADKIAARASIVAPSVDLALLELDDDSFFETHRPLSLDDQLPKVKDTVNVYGYPVGGTEQSITEGIVSRMEYALVSVDVAMLRIQIDAALNPGNSGGPAVAKDKVVGLVFQTLNLASGKGRKRAENIGYLISVEEIQMFLSDIDDGIYQGKPLEQGVHYQLCQNDALRSWMGLKDEMIGSLVSRILNDDPDFPLKPWDLITHIGPHPIDSEGKIRVHDDLRLPAVYMTPYLVDNGTVELAVVREGRHEKIQVPVVYESKRLVPSQMMGYPSYFIYGPMIFTPVTTSFMQSLPSYYRFPFYSGRRPTDMVSFEGEELVALVPPLLPHRIIEGYMTQLAYGIVSSVNDVKIRNLRHLVETIRDADGEYIAVRLADSGDALRNEVIVFRRKELESSTQDILEDNGIRYQLSKDLTDAWKVVAEGP